VSNSGRNLDKSLQGLTLNECYRRIYDWHTINKNSILGKLPKKSDDPYVVCYQRLVAHLPDPREAAREDIVFVCIEVISGLMEWAYSEKDEEGIKISTYAHYILGTFFDGFGGEETRSFYQKSKLYKDYSMVNCLAKVKPTAIDGYLEELLRASGSERVEEAIQLLLKQSKDNVKNVVDAAVDKILVNEYDGSKWSTLAVSISASFKKHKEAGRILEELVKKDPENAAHHNNLGVNYLSRKLLGSAIKSFATAFALDYEANRKKAFELPAWKNLVFLCSTLDKSFASPSKK